MYRKGRLNVKSNVQEKHVIWVQAASDSGCSISVLNSVRPEIHSVLFDELVPGHHINLLFQATIMAGQGEQVVSVLDDPVLADTDFLLVVEGAVPFGKNYCFLGEEGGKDISIARRITDLARHAEAVISVGTCASFGGIFASYPNVTQCAGAGELLAKEKINKPLINIPGCPPHPDWFLGTLAHLILFGLPGPEELDELNRPKLFYGQLIHENCPRRAHFDAGRFAKRLSEPYCLYLLGCRGPVTHADCPTRQWNNGVNWCIENNHPCLGCCEPEFPDGTSPFFEKRLDIHAPALRKDTSGRLKAQNTVTAFPGRHTEDGE